MLELKHMILLAPPGTGVSLSTLEATCNESRGSANSKGCGQSATGAERVSHKRNAEQTSSRDLAEMEELQGRVRGCISRKRNWTRAYGTFLGGTSVRRRLGLRWKSG
jgi:hypothetical protein